MTIFERLWSWLSDLLSHFWTNDGPALEAWLKQFASDEGKTILQDTAIYGPQIFAGTITILEAAAKVWVDLKAKGIEDTQALVEIVLNALRTHTNAAAATSQVGA